jgi:outer membrane protein OmpA-like peptidoglycan-associated protein
MLAAAVLAAGLSGCAQVSGVGARVQISSTPRCTDFFFPVSFVNKSDALTPQAERVVADAGGHAKGCPMARVQVVGLAEDSALPQPDGALSLQRAGRLAEALVKAGLPRPTFKLRAVGEDGAIAEDVARPVHRRTTVYIVFER